MKYSERRRSIINEYLKNPRQNPKNIADSLLFDQSYVEFVINEYKKDFVISHPIYMVKSMSDQNTYFLFSNDEEKTLIIRNNIIQNEVTLTQYEQSWLEVNKEVYLKSK